MGIWTRAQVVPLAPARAHKRQSPSTMRAYMTAETLTMTAVTSCFTCCAVYLASVLRRPRRPDWKTVQNAAQIGEHSNSLFPDVACQPQSAQEDPGQPAPTPQPGSTPAGATSVPPHGTTHAIPAIGPHAASSPGGSSHAFYNELGVQAAVSFWDPIWYNADGDETASKRHRQTELKHGRISMLATMGYTTPELADKCPGILSPPAGLKFAVIPNGLKALTAAPALCASLVVPSHGPAAAAPSAAQPVSSSVAAGTQVAEPSGCTLQGAAPLREAEELLSQLAAQDLLRQLDAEECKTQRRKAKRKEQKLKAKR